MNLEDLPIGTKIVVDGKEWTKETYLKLDMWCDKEVCVSDEYFSKSKTIKVVD